MQSIACRQCTVCPQPSGVAVVHVVAAAYGAIGAAAAREAAVAHWMVAAYGVVAPVRGGGRWGGRHAWHGRGASDSRSAAHAVATQGGEGSGSRMGAAAAAAALEHSVELGGGTELAVGCIGGLRSCLALVVCFWGASSKQLPGDAGHLVWPRACFRRWASAFLPLGRPLSLACASLSHCVFREPLDVPGGCVVRALAGGSVGSLARSRALPQKAQNCHAGSVQGGGGRRVFPSGPEPRAVQKAMPAQGAASSARGVASVVLLGGATRLE